MLFFPLIPSQVNNFKGLNNNISRQRKVWDITLVSSPLCLGKNRVELVNMQSLGLTALLQGITQESNQFTRTLLINKDEFN